MHLMRAVFCVSADDVQDTKPGDMKIQFSHSAVVPHVSLHHLRDPCQLLQSL